MDNELMALKSRRFFSKDLAGALPEGTTFTIKSSRWEALTGMNGKIEQTFILGFGPDWPELTMNGVRTSAVRTLFGSLNDGDILGKEVVLRLGRAQAANKQEYEMVLIEGPE